MSECERICSLLHPVSMRFPWVESGGGCSLQLFSLSLSLRTDGVSHLACRRGNTPDEMWGGGSPKREEEKQRGKMTLHKNKHHHYDLGSAYSGWYPRSTTIWLPNAHESRTRENKMTTAGSRQQATRQLKLTTMPSSA